MKILSFVMLSFIKYKMFAVMRGVLPWLLHVFFCNMTFLCNKLN